MVVPSLAEEARVRKETAMKKSGIFAAFFTRGISVWFDAYYVGYTRQSRRASGDTYCRRIACPQVASN